MRQSSTLPALCYSRPTLIRQHINRRKLMGRSDDEERREVRALLSSDDSGSEVSRPSFPLLPYSPSPLLPTLSILQETRHRTSATSYVWVWWLLGGLAGLTLICLVLWLFNSGRIGSGSSGSTTPASLVPASTATPTTTSSAGFVSTGGSGSKPTYLNGAVANPSQTTATKVSSSSNNASKIVSTGRVVLGKSGTDLMTLPHSSGCSDTSCNSRDPNLVFDRHARWRYQYPHRFLFFRGFQTRARRLFTARRRSLYGRMERPQHTL
jgi:hypothetical protein